MHLNRAQKKVLLIYAILILLTCILAVPVDYFKEGSSSPVDYGVSPIWARTKNVSFQTGNGWYSGDTYIIKVNLERVWVQVVGYSILAAVSFVLLKDK